MHFSEIGRFLLVAGSVLVLVGVLFVLWDKIPLGRLPGDLNTSIRGVHISVPVATCILLSIAVTLVVNFFSPR